MTNQIYMIVDAFDIPNEFSKKTEKISRLLLLQNPLKDKKSWKGDWSFGSTKFMTHKAM